MKTKVMITILFISIFLGISTVQADIVWTEGYHQYDSLDFHEHVDVFNDVRLDILNCKFDYLHTYDSTLTNWYDGMIYYLLNHDNSIINIYGGSILIGLGSDGNSLINLYAYDIKHHLTGGLWDSGWIEGRYLTTNSHFTFDLWGQDTYSHINIVPEPSTILLLGFGCLIFRKIR